MLDCDEVMDEFLINRGILIKNQQQRQEIKIMKSKEIPLSEENFFGKVSKNSINSDKSKERVQSITPLSVELLKANRSFSHASIPLPPRQPSLPRERDGKIPQNTKISPSSINSTLDEFIFPREVSGPKIEVINTVDLQGIPKDFQYIEESIYSSGVSLPDLDFLVGCDCFDCGKSEYCLCKENNNESLPYNKQGCLINFEKKTAIFECNDRCFCGPACNTRVVQKGRKIPLILQKFGDGRGWGVLAKQVIPKGTFVSQYVGEIITNQEASKRYKKYASTGAHQMMYLFDLDYNYENGLECDFTIDAFKYGNISHFINHSCEPNLTVRPVLVNNLDPRMHLIALFAAKEILPGEELCFDYMGLRDGSNNDHSRSLLSVGTLKKPKLKCLCGAVTCRKYVYL